MNKGFIFFISLLFFSCNQIQYGEKNDIGYTYYFNSISGKNSNIGTKNNPLKTLDFLDNINLKEGDKILLANGSTFFNTIWWMSTLSVPETRTNNKIEMHKIQNNFVHVDFVGA